MDNTPNNFEQEFEEFKQRWFTLHPQPEKKTYPQENNVYRYLLFLAVVAAMFVSGAHTVPTIMKTMTSVSAIWQKPLAFAAFIMVELLITTVTAQLAHAGFRGANKPMRWITSLMVISLFFAISLAITANLYQAVEGFGGIASNRLVGLVAILTGLVPPLTAFIGGALLEVQNYYYKLDCRRIDLQNEQSAKEYWETMVKAFNQQQNKKQPKPVKVEPKIAYNIGEARQIIQRFLTEQPKAKTVEVKKHLEQLGIKMPQASLYKTVEEIKQN